MAKTVLKRALSFVLASMIIISSVCCLAFAQAETENPNKITITTKFYKYDEAKAEWVETDRADKGENLKVRVFIDTSYYAATGNLLFFYDKALFTDNYSRTAIITSTLNSASGSFTKEYNISSEFGFLKETARPIQTMIANNYITQEFAAEHECISFAFYPLGVTTCHKIDGDYWFAEFELTVREDSEFGEGDFFVVPESLASPERKDAPCNISVGEENGSTSEMILMSEIQVDFEFVSTGIKNYSDVKLDADGGEFENGTVVTEKVALDGSFSLSDFEIPEREGYKFIGWIDDSTGNKAEDAYDVDYKDFSFTAEWEALKYKVSYTDDEGAEIESFEAVYGEQVPVTAETPEKEGFVFKGWSPEIPDSMPAKDLVFSPVWEGKEYKLTFVAGSKTAEYNVPFGADVSEYGYELPECATLVCWLDENGNEAAIPETMPAKAVTLTAKLSYAYNNSDGIEASFDDGCFESADEVKFVAKAEQGSDVDSYFISDGKAYSKVNIYNVDFTDGQNQIKPVDGKKVKISIPVPAGFGNGKLVLVYRNANGDWEIRQAEIENGKFVFETDEFGYYGIYALSELRVKSNPRKTSYNYRDSFSADGLELEIVRPDGVSYPVTDKENVKVSGYEPRKTGTQTLTVEYSGMITSVKVNVSYAWWQMLIRILLLGFLWY